jgi:hypothetical protein
LCRIPDFFDASNKEMRVLRLRRYWQSWSSVHEMKLLSYPAKLGVISFRFCTSPRVTPLTLRPSSQCRCLPCGVKIAPQTPNCIPSPGLAISLLDCCSIIHTGVGLTDKDKRVNAAAVERYTVRCKRREYRRSPSGRRSSYSPRQNGRI